MKDLRFFPLGYFCLVASLGLLMRLFPFVGEIPLKFENVRHAHSHIAFLGWVCSGYFLLIFQNFFSDNNFTFKKIRPYFIALQVFSIALAVTFFISGYSNQSIVLLSIHTVLVYGIILYTIYRLKHQSIAMVNQRFLVFALAFFCLSTLAPFLMPIILVLDLYSAANKNLLIQSFLHFQIHGWFIFGMLALLLQHHTKNTLSNHQRPFHFSFLFLFIGLLSTYLFTFMDIKEGNKKLEVIGQIGCMIQIIGFSIFYQIHHKNRLSFIQKNGNIHYRVSQLVLVILLFKSGFEMLRTFNDVIAIDLVNHFFVIAFLHLILLGAVTLYIIDAIRLDFNITVSKKKYFSFLLLFLIGFLLTEIELFGFGAQIPFFQPYYNETLLVAAIFLFMASFLIYSLLTKDQPVSNGWQSTSPINHT